MINLLINSKACFDSQGKVNNDFDYLVQHSQSENINIVIVSREVNMNSNEKIINNHFGDNHTIKYYGRGEASKKFIEKNNLSSKDFILIGAVDQDLPITSNNNILLINPGWVSVSSKIEKYGFKISDSNQLVSCINIMRLNSNVYARNNISEITELISLTTARNFMAPPNQDIIINNYRDYLKYGKDLYRFAVFFHYLTLITQNDEFENVNIWTSAPSSTGERTNGIYKIEDYSRYLMSNKRQREIFIRHSSAEKSTDINSTERKSLDSSRHFNTVHLNPKYKDEIKGSTIVVLDDYVTNGHTFETVRILLEKAGAKKIYLITMGTYKNPYQKQDVKLSDDIFQSSYKFTINSKENLYLNYNESALTVIDRIHNIIY